MISASIVTYKNNLDVLEKTITSYLAATEGNKLFVIDNSPSDAVRKICDHHRIEYIPNPNNVGYGRAHNMALRQSIQHSKYHLVLNPDVFFESAVIKNLIDFMETHQDVGLVMPKVLYPDGRLQPLCKLLPKPHQLFARRFLNSFQKVMLRMNYEYEMWFTRYDQVTEVPFLSGCFMLLRSEALKKVGLFDENFFLYFEDTDLSRRVHQYYKTVYYPSATIHHIHERGSHKRLKHLYHSISSAVYYFNKWGWYFDREREQVNQKILIQHGVNGYHK